jgi:hypothetical protein
MEMLCTSYAVFLLGDIRIRKLVRELRERRVNFHRGRGTNWSFATTNRAVTVVAPAG